MKISRRTFLQSSASLGALALGHPSRAPGAGELPVGATLDQYHHVIDIAPTLLEMICYSNAAEAGGEVLPLQGLSMAYTLDNPGAPTSKTLQHYETSGDRGIWAEGWKAVTRH